LNSNESDVVVFFSFACKKLHLPLLNRFSYFSRAQFLIAEFWRKPKKAREKQKINAKLQRVWDKIGEWIDE
jgi:hypothetical protein